MGNQKYIQYKSKGLCRRCGAEPLIGKTRCSDCHTAHLEYQRRAKDRLATRGVCRWCAVRQRAPDASMCPECLEGHRKRGVARYAERRRVVIAAYGGSCVCCGTKNQKYLQLDHVNNDGAEHRRALTGDRKGGSIYTWASRNSYPDTLQLLCANCHQAKTTHGGCSDEDHST